MSVSVCCLHSVMISGPLGPDELALLVDLVLEVVAECVEPVREVLLERVQSLMHEVHLLHRVLFVRCDVSIQKRLRTQYVDYA